MEKNKSSILKLKQVFSSDLERRDESLKPSQYFSTQDAYDEIDSKNESTEDVFSGSVLNTMDEVNGNLFKPSAKGPKKRHWWMRLIFVLFVLLIGSELYLGLQAAWKQSHWLFALYTSLVLLVSIGVLKWVVLEWRKLIKLRGVEETQQVGMRLSDSMQMGEADPFVDNIVARLPPSPAIKAYFAACSDEHNDAEKLVLFEKWVLQDRDLAAKKLVRRFAGQSTLLLAASPLAFVDMAFMLWRNQRMINDVAACYGIELGYWSRIKLVRGILVNIIYAGTSEVMTDLGTQLLSVEMSGKLSARLAQGLGGGLLTARLGYQAMALCRPLAFDADSKPKLSGIHKELLLELKTLSSSVLAMNKQKKNRQRKKDFTP
ncbi:TIGR01620 family protein [uncultured Shewanella sp.]|uniref:TIGR01620 family protein n=1 Tax=uncultured Shewanella sp. TaxID=173975 RepID=UPI0026082431|nr:TIGR01620 family protein [uncultured Shewanella sp.]